MTQPPEEIAREPEPSVSFENTWLYKVVVLSVLGLTVLCFLVSVGLSLFVENPPAGIERLVDRTWQAFLMGFSAILGLIGGKSL